jgi:hypothetical protein
MPSPFPGMDPYLEERSLWPDLHSSLISYIRETLQPQVRPKYVARIGERIALETLGKGHIPDVMVVEPPRERSGAQAAFGMLVADEPQTISVLDEERRVPYLEIIYRETGDVVTLIEILSPANKIGGGREQYIQKQDDLLNSQVNLVEVDLLSGQTSTFARLFEINSPHDWRYIISISRPQRRNRLEVYAIALKDRLPRCKIPLLQEDDDAVLDLPTVFSRCYDVGSYDLLLNYRNAPPVSLSQAEDEWMAAFLLEKGIRSGQLDQ